MMIHRLISPRIACRALILLGVILTIGPASRAAESADDQLHKLIDDVWEFRLRDDPLLATSAGDHRYDDQLPKVSLADEKRTNDENQRFLDRLEAIDHARLSPPDRENFDILRRDLSNDIAEYDFGDYMMPINSREGFHVEFPELRRDVPLDTIKDYENYITRLAAFDEYVKGHIELMRAGIATDHTQPAVILQGYEPTVETHIVDDPEKSLMYEPLKEFPSTVPEAQRERLRQAARAAIRDGVVAGYRRFRDFLRDEYVPAARPSIAASALPDGRAFYRHRVREFTTLELTPDEVHQMGLDEVSRIRDEMNNVMHQVKFDGDLHQFIEYLRTDPKFYASTPEELMQHAALILKRTDGELPKLFGHLPRMPYGLRPVPDYIAPRTSSAYYESPNGDGTRAGYFYLNTYNLNARPLYGLESLCCHEAVPGHHLQLALQQESDQPKFRRFGGFTAFIEGWGLYAERLGLEAGCYKDPYSNFGRLSMEMWRACRLVVDTGIHYFNWTRQQAIAFMLENSAESPHNIEAEVDRYIGWPGQALAYKVGELKIRQLRALAEKELGEKFDVRKFHDAVLGGGAVPLDVLDTRIRSWIEEQRAAR